MATPEAYGISQARGPTGATAASLHYSHSNASAAETAKTVATEGDKQHSEIRKSKVLFSTGAGSEESPPESEHQVFVFSNFYTLQGLEFPM